MGSRDFLSKVGKNRESDIFERAEVSPALLYLGCRLHITYPQSMRRMDSYSVGVCAVARGSCWVVRFESGGSYRLSKRVSIALT